MKYLSVCSGIEAATVAWHGLGWTPAAFAEVEAFPSAVLAVAFQLNGDRSQPSVSVSEEKAFCIPSNPMSDRSQAVAFREPCPTLTAKMQGSSGWAPYNEDEHLVGVPAVPFTKAKRAQSNTDDESWVPGDVAPTQNQFDQGDTRATTVVAFANRTRDGVKVPEVMKDGVVPALTNPGDGGRSDAVNVVAPGPVQVQWASGGGQVENPTMQSLRSNAEYNYQFIRNAMQVRRLTPTECAYLQGFPADYLDITFRKKPAADGPKYRALGNSMAVPCMWWLGMRIHNATSHA